LEGPHYWKVGSRTAFSGVLKLPVGGGGAGASPNEQWVRVCVYPSYHSSQPNFLPSLPILSDQWLVRIGYWFNTIKKISGEKGKKDSFLKAMNTGRVHAILFLEGATVPAHEPLLILEAFGVLVPHALPVEVHVGKWQVTAEEKVQVGQELAHLLLI